MKQLSLLLLVVALFLETVVTTVPLVLLLLLSMIVLKRENVVFVYAFISGLLIDALSFQTLGVSSLFYCTFLFLVILYERKFEIATTYFILAASFFGSFFYIFLFSDKDFVIFESFLSAIIGLALFKLLQRVGKLK